MQAAVALFTKVGAGLGVAGTGAAATGASALGTAFSTFGTVAALGTQAAALKDAARVEEQNALAAIERGQADAQDADFELAALLGADTAAQGASGLQINSGSFVRTRARRQVIGRANRQRIIQDAGRQAQSARNRAAANRSSAKGKVFESAFGLASGAVNLGADLISGANLARRTATGSTNRTRIAI